MIISLLVAMDEAGGIGQGGGLPWHLSTDLKRFKALTMGHHLIMGRKTYESIGRALPGRITVIITRTRDYRPAGCPDPHVCHVTHSLDEALSLAEQSGENEAFVIGGGQIFALALPLADRIYLTRVHTISQADTFFPAFNEAEWRSKESRRYPADEKNQYATTYQILERVSP